MRYFWWFVLLLLASCAPTPLDKISEPAPDVAPEPGEVKTEVTEVSELPEPQPIQPVREPVRVPEPVEAVEPSPIVPPEPGPEPTLGFMESWLENVSKKVKSVQFRHESNDFYIRDDAMRIIFFDIVRAGYDEERRSNIFVDTIYVNLTTETVVGYCERRIERTKTMCDLILDVPYNLTFEDFYIKTPLDWLEERSEDPISATRNAAVEDEKDVARFEWDDVIMWVGEHTLLPIKVEVLSDGPLKKIYKYERMAINSVRDEDLTHGQIIPG